jgi:hypothetical protein
MNSVYPTVLWACREDRSAEICRNFASNVLDCFVIVLNGFEQFHDFGWDGNVAELGHSDETGVTLNGHDTW